MDNQELDAAFERATQEVTALPEAPDNMTKLRLYALYKQATAGDCTGPAPGKMDFIARAKHDAWAALQGTSESGAKRAYIDAVEGLKNAS